MTIAAGTYILVTGSPANFTADMVGKEIWKPYDVNGQGGGRATIWAFTDTSHIKAQLLTDFENLDDLNAGRWQLTTGVVNNLQLLEGQTVNVVEDGGEANDKVVTNGKITLDKQSSKVFVGLKYRGTIELLNPDVGGERGPAEAKPRNLIKLAVRFLNTIGTKIGTSIYRLERWLFRSSDDSYGRPTPPFSGIKEQPYRDQWEKTGKTVVVLQEHPLPCTITAIDYFMEASDE